MLKLEYFPGMKERREKELHKTAVTECGALKISNIVSFVDILGGIFQSP